MGIKLVLLIDGSLEVGIEGFAFFHTFISLYCFYLYHNNTCWEAIKRIDNKICSLLFYQNYVAPRTLFCHQREEI